MTNQGNLLCATETVVQCRACREIEFCREGESITEFAERLDLIGWEADEETAICPKCLANPNQL